MTKGQASDLINRGHQYLYCVSVPVTYPHTETAQNALERCKQHLTAFLTKPMGCSTLKGMFYSGVFHPIWRQTGSSSNMALWTLLVLCTQTLQDTDN